MGLSFFLYTDRSIFRFMTKAKGRPSTSLDEEETRSGLMLAKLTELLLMIWQSAKLSSEKVGNYLANWRAHSTKIKRESQL